MNMNKLLFNNGSAYSKFRPTYPLEIYNLIHKYYNKYNQHYPPSIICDIGCGTGQATCALADYFNNSTIFGLDTSSSQLNNAKEKEIITYKKGSAESLPFEDNSIDIITVAQAAHWFDFDKCWIEMKRCLKKDGILAIWTYGIAKLDNKEANDLFYNYHTNVMGKYWDERRILVDNNYRDIHIPFEEQTIQTLIMKFDMTLLQVYNYLGTQSCLKTFKEMNSKQSDPRDQLLNDFLNAYGKDDAATTHVEISFDLTLILSKND